MEMMTERRQVIFNCVVETHIETAQPVGSRPLRERYGLDYSPATLRNEMGLLGEMGYLTQPHTSSGRVPTDLGYRYYVDQVVARSSRIPQDLCGRMESYLRDMSRDFEEVDSFVEEASRLLARFAREASVFFLSDLQGSGPAGRERIRVYLQGSSHILEKPEFQDINKVRLLFQAFEEKVKLLEWIAAQTESESVSIRIGEENKPEAFRECSVIATQYHIGRGKGGTVALVGPKRMRYIYTIPLVSSVAAIMGRVAEGRYSGS